MAKIDISKLVKKTTESFKDIDFKDSLKDLQDKGKDTFDVLKKKSEETIKKVEDALSKTNEKTYKLTIQDALRIMYYLIAIDGELTNDELDKFVLIGQDTDPGFHEYKTELLKELKQTIEATDKEDYEDNIRDLVGEAILNSQYNKNAKIDGKLFIWNLLAISYSDGECLESERKLIRYVTKQLEIDKSVILEMESYVYTLNAIEKEEFILKQSNKPYSIIESKINELSDRKKAIMQGVHALLVD